MEWVSAEADVRLLLRFYHDVQPSPRIGTFGQGKEGPSHNIGCPECHGLGWVRARKFGQGVVRLDSGILTKSCKRCSGRGWYPADDYTGREVGTEETGLADAPARTVFCDGCGGNGVHGNGRRCRYCEGAGTVAIPADVRERKPGRSDAMTEALRAGRATGSPGLWAAGSFAALESAISELTIPMRYRLWADDLPADLVSILAARVRHIERGKIRVPSSDLGSACLRVRLGGCVPNLQMHGL
jgi:hypothetical protein